MKYLIRFRDKVDIYYDNEIDNYFQHAGNIQEMNQELIALYVSLDYIIKKCNFTKEQMAIIKLSEMGFTFGDIAGYFEGVGGEQVKRKFNTICKKIVNINNELWIINILFNYVKNEWKMCSRCKNILPMNERFFRSHPLTKNNFQSQCRQCERKNDTLKKYSDI